MILDCSGTRCDICRGVDGFFKIDCRTSFFARGVEIKRVKELRARRPRIATAEGE